jgi:hypothetical protein
MQCRQRAVVSLLYASSCVVNAAYASNVQVLAASSSSTVLSKKWLVCLYDRRTIRRETLLRALHIAPCCEHTLKQQHAVRILCSAEKTEPKTEPVSVCVTRLSKESPLFADAQTDDVCAAVDALKLPAVGHNFSNG